MNILMKMKFPKWPALFYQIPTRRLRNYIETICRRKIIEYSQTEWTSKTFLENTYNYTCLCSFLVREKLPTTRLFTITCTCIKYSLFFFCYIHFVFCRQHKHLWLYYLYNNLHYHSIKTMSNTLYKVNKCTHKHLILHLQLISVIYIYV